ncbi:response regulator (plasmid) [Sinorhizobium meliloti]|nr:response regulator [Sinorhizobium meliloti]
MPLSIDDELVRRALCRLVLSLSSSRWRSPPARCSSRNSKEAKPSCVLLDLHMPNMNGLDILHELRGRQPRLAVIVITGADEEGVRGELHARGRRGFP